MNTIKYIAAAMMAAVALLCFIGANPVVAGFIALAAAAVTLIPRRERP